MQQGMLFHQLSAGGHTGVDLEQIIVRSRQPIDAVRLRHAFQQVGARHAALRTTFRLDDQGHPIQEVHDEVELPCEEFEVQGESDFEAWLVADRKRGFDPSQLPLCRIAVFRGGADDHGFVWTFPHLILDGRAFAIILGEVLELDRALAHGRTPELPEPRRFSEHLAWLDARDRSHEAPYWRTALAGFTSATPLPERLFEGDATGHAEHAVRLPRALGDALRVTAAHHQVTPNTLVLSAWAILLARHGGQAEVVFGATRACRRSSVPHAEHMAGTFINTLPLRICVDRSASVPSLLQSVRAQTLALREVEHTPLADVQRFAEVPGGQPLFESIVMFDRETLDATMKALGDVAAGYDFELREQSSFPLTLYAYDEPELLLKLSYQTPNFDQAAASSILARLVQLLEALGADSDRPIGAVPILPGAERHTVIEAFNRTERAVPADVCVHQLIAAQAARTPDRTAVTSTDQALTYRQLDERSNQLARHLMALGVGPDVLVALAVTRSVDLLVAMLGIHKAGGAYVPMDANYPRDRLELMLSDSGARVLLTTGSLVGDLPATIARVVRIDDDWSQIKQEDTGPVDSGVTPQNLAYMIYTSGSTGVPKGVLVEHQNLINFCVGMDDVLGTDPGVWLAVTSLSFDISALELLWPLTHGYEVVVQAAEHLVAAPLLGAGRSDKKLDFSLFYFAADEGLGGSDKYRLLLDGAKFADENGFTAVWTPERHFHGFGGLYPNPAVTGAAIAAITKNVKIRAGSVVVPLHNPLRVAEEWSVVDNISRGRVEISVASGWHPEDFVLRPDTYARRKQAMFEDTETIRALWRGERRTFEGPNGPVEVGTMPRPIQPELPIFVTAAGSPETFESAGRMGAYVLTHMLGQSDEDLTANIAKYRAAWTAAGHSGTGHVALMLHTFVGDDDQAVADVVRGPMIEYLRSAVGLVKNFANAWTAFKRGKAQAQLKGDELTSLSPEEMDDLLAFAFERYYETSGLFGTQARCLAMLDRVRAMDADEVACLVDFGVEPQLAFEHLAHLNRLRIAATPDASPVARDYSVPAQIVRHGVTHLQCTPSMAAMLLMHEENRTALGRLSALLIGGEAFPAHLARELRQTVGGALHNMYGPTETTIWSTTHRLEPEENGNIPIGRPIANTQIYILDDHLQPVPPKVVGELWIGGLGVVRGYHERPEMTEQRFVADPFRPGHRMYRTGDLARHRPDGIIDFLGRVDHQVKIRGYRIELGEIEALLAQQPNVRDVVVVAREDASGGDKSLAAFVTAKEGRLDTAALRAALREKLPEFMVPAHVVQLAELPLTPNKKIDRKALPSIEEATSDRVGEVVEPENDLEARILGIWREVLDVPRVGTRDNFFDLGGHSLLAVQVHTRLRKVTDRPVTITDLFRFPTVAALAEHLSRDEAQSTPLRDRVAAMSNAGGRADTAARRREIHAALRKGSK